MHCGGRLLRQIICLCGPAGRGEERGVRFENLEAAETRILDLLSDRPYQPTEVAAVLRGQFDDRTVREAIWRLINATEIDWTAERTLRRMQLAHG